MNGNADSHSTSLCLQKDCKFCWHQNEKDGQIQQILTINQNDNYVNRRPYNIGAERKFASVEFSVYSRWLNHLIENT